MSGFVGSQVSNDERLANLEQVLFRPMGADGVRARTGLYERVLDGLTDFISTFRPEAAEVYRFPPVMSRSDIEKSGYLQSFPNLVGFMCCLAGSPAEIRRTANRIYEGEPWTEGLGVADLVLTPASCYPVYPIAAAKGAAPDQGWIFDVGCECFRREPSRDIDRMQSFRQREYVCIGSPETVCRFRDDWIVKAQSMAEQLQLPYSVDVANDPFFGAGGQFLAAGQREQKLKFELLIPILSHDKPTACMSFNYHKSHFGEAWDIHLARGGPAHTGCVGFGMDRMTIAMFAHHGLDLSAWPQPVLTLLGL